MYGLLIDVVLSSLVIPGIGVFVSSILTRTITAVIARRIVSKRITEDVMKISDRITKEGLNAPDPKEKLYQEIYDVVKRHHTQRAIKEIDNKKYLEYFSDFFSDSSQLSVS